LVVGLDGVQATDLVELEEITAKYQASIVHNISMGDVLRAIIVELEKASVTPFIKDAYASGFVLAGGGLFVIGDDYLDIYLELTDFLLALLLRLA